MSHQQLKARLYAVAIDGLRSANRNNPFLSKSEAMRDLNTARRIATR